MVERTDPKHPHRVASRRFGVVMRSRRERKNWSMMDLALKVGITKQSVFKLEKGINVPLLGVARVIAKTLGFSLDKLEMEW